MKTSWGAALLVAAGLACAMPCRADAVDDALQPVPYSGYDRLTAAKYHDLLELEITEALAPQGYAPLPFTVGESGTTLLFSQSAEEMAALSRAYPYLSRPLQQRVKDALLTLFREHPPYSETACYLSAGLAMPRTNVPAWRGLKPERKPPLGIGGLYALWLFADRTNSWDAVQVQWPDIRLTLGAEPMRSFHIDPRTGHWAMNSVVAGLIAYVRFAEHFREEADARAGRARLAAILEQLRAYWSERRLPAGERLIGGDASATGDALVILADQTPRADLPASWDLACLADMRPEIARFLSAEPMHGNVVALLRALDTAAPAWYAAWAEGYAARGQDALAWPDDRPGILAAKSLIQNLPLDNLAHYADIPLGKADYQHMEKLVTLMERSGE